MLSRLKLVEDVVPGTVRNIPLDVAAIVVVSKRLLEVADMAK
jgi:hypothetical protein